MIRMSFFYSIGCCQLGISTGKCGQVAGGQRRLISPAASKGKPVEIRRGPAAVTGDEPCRTPDLEGCESHCARGAWEGAG